MNTVEILTKVKEKISNPEHWAKGAMFKDENGIPTSFSSQACSFCIVGAVSSFIVFKEKEKDVRITKVLDILYDNVIKYTQFKSIGRFNDHPYTTHEDVMDFLDIVINQEKCNN